MTFLSPFLLAACAAPLHRVFAENPWAVDRLRKFDGRLILLEVGRGFRLGLCVNETDGLVPVALAEDSSADLHVRLPAGSLPDLLNDRDAALSAAQITGAVDFAEAVSFVMRNLRIDAGDMLAPLTGDLLAHRISHLFEYGRRQAQSVANRAHANLIEYLHYESGLFVERNALSNMQSDIVALGKRLERLESRIARLRLPGNSAN